MAPTLEQVLDEWREQVNVARELHDERIAKLIEQIVGDVARAERARLSWLNDIEAALYSGLTVEALHRRFPRMTEAGDGRWTTRGRRARQYRESALPRREKRRILRASAQEAVRRSS